jgi:CelD/BcsL family acetyltransferase involved in cellulose biosynthesis
LAVTGLDAGSGLARSSLPSAFAHLHGPSRPLVEWRPLASLNSIFAEWAALAQRAIEPNVFYEPAFALAATSAFGKDAGAVLVWSGSKSRQLLGFFPARIERYRYGLPLSVLVGWTHSYAPLGTPLVDRAAAEAVISAWLDHIAADAQFPGLVLLPYLALDGPVARALRGVLGRHAGSLAFSRRHARALVAPAGERGSYIERAIPAKKRKELRRQRKRLAEMGNLVSATATTVPDITVALDHYFELEAAGWKGRAGTAARCRKETADLVAQAVIGLAREGKAEIVRLCIDTRPIAALIVLRSGDTGWCWKIAHDERYGRFSPGLQVLLDATQRLLGNEHIRRVDSCATPDHPMIDHVWRERLPIADCLFAVAPADAQAFAIARRCETTRRALISAGKALRDFLRGRP